MDLRLIWFLLALTSGLGTHLSNGDGDPEYSQEVNNAGTLFAFMTNPVINPGVTADQTEVPSSAAQESATTIESPPPPATPTRNPVAETQTIPLGDSVYTSPAPDTLLVQGNRNPYRPLPVQYGVGSQAVALADQNFDLTLTNERLTQESADLWQRLVTALGKMESYRVDRMREEDDFSNTETALERSNSDLDDENANLESQIDSLQQQYEESVRRLGEYQQNVTATQAAIVVVQNQTQDVIGQATETQAEIQRMRVIVQATPVTGNATSADDALDNRIAREEVLVSVTPESTPVATTNNLTQTGILRVDTNDDENDDNGDDLEASTDMVYVIGLCFTFLLFSTLRVWMGHRIDSYLTPTLYSLFADVSILALLAIATGVMNHCDWFDRDKIDLRKIMYGMGVFLVFWFMLGLWLVLSTQAMARTWFKAENECVDLRRVSQNYEDAYLEYTVEDGARISYSAFSAAQNVMQYAVMRQEFICPTYLPYTTEMFLRSDFNLAEYLAKCFAEVLIKGMQLTGLGFAVLVVSAGTWRFVIYFGFKMDLALFLTVPVVSILTCIVVIEKLKSVYFELVPYVYDPHEFHLPSDNFSRNPMLNVDKVPIPPYLTGSLEHLQNDSQYSCCWVQTNPLKLTCAYIFIGKYPNRHELLFWFDMYGPQFCTGVIQGVALILTFWMVVILIYYVPNLWDELEVWGIMAAVAAVLIWLFNALYLLPEALRYLTLTSKIEQMKDRKKVEEVMLTSRNKRALKTVDLYRQIKLIHREMSRDEGKPDFQGNVPLPESMERYLFEVFSLSCDQDTDLLPISGLSDALELCGMQLSNEELRVFIWETDTVSG